MDIAELPEALSALARDLERRDDDPFTLRSHAAVRLAMRIIEDERRAAEAARVGGTANDLAPARLLADNADLRRLVGTLSDRDLLDVLPTFEAAVRGQAGDRISALVPLMREAIAMINGERRWLEQAVGHPGPPASEQEDYNPAADLSTYRDALIERLDNEMRFHRENMEIRRALLGPDHYRIGLATKDLLATRLPSAVLLRLASHLLPTFASDEAEMDSPEVDLEAFGISREDPEAKLLLEHMNLGSGDAGWPRFPMAYVASGLSAYLLAVSKAEPRDVPAPSFHSIDLLGFEAALHAAKTPEEKRRVFEQFIPLKGG